MRVPVPHATLGLIVRFVYCGDLGALDGDAAGEAAGGGTLFLVQLVAAAAVLGLGSLERESQAQLARRLDERNIWYVSVHAWRGGGRKRKRKRKRRREM